MDPAKNGSYLASSLQPPELLYIFWLHLNVNAPLSKLLWELCYAAIIWVAWESGLDLIPAHLKVIYQEIDDRKHLLSDIN